MASRNEMLLLTDWVEVWLDWPSVLDFKCMVLHPLFFLP